VVLTLPLPTPEMSAMAIVFSIKSTKQVMTTSVRTCAMMQQA
jgi:hypothetical protein